MNDAESAARRNRGRTFRHGSRVPILKQPSGWKFERTFLGSDIRIENRLMDMGRGEERVRGMERVTWKLTLPSVK